ncbi:hypothetical protein Cadr_000021146 [Camelus dromedarius]|uniref:Uncharacterized protein n=1 Tax=Camelus dromedarius TaxID=9838 RepID=A0A5N4CUM6_CAMDR|nr:hypothetical protein Cadr_000021146 [Camelus dromedarius]
MEKDDRTYPFLMQELACWQKEKPSRREHQERFAAVPALTLSRTPRCPSGQRISTADSSTASAVLVNGERLALLGRNREGMPWWVAGENKEVTERRQVCDTGKKSNSVGVTTGRQPWGPGLGRQEVA